MEYDRVGIWMEILLVIHFIDSQKAFDCLRRDGRLNIMWSHSIPVKLNLNIIKLLYRVLRVLSLIMDQHQTVLPLGWSKTVCRCLDSSSNQQLTGSCNKWLTKHQNRSKFEDDRVTRRCWFYRWYCSHLLYYKTDVKESHQAWRHSQ